MSQFFIEFKDCKADLVPSLELIEKIEEQFGALQSILQRIKAGQMTLHDHKELIGLVFEKNNMDLEGLVKEEGVSGLIRRNIKIIGLCLAGLNGIESLYQEAESLGKPVTTEPTTLTD